MMSTGISPEPWLSSPSVSGEVVGVVEVAGDRTADAVLAALAAGVDVGLHLLGDVDVLLADRADVVDGGEVESRPCAPRSVVGKRRPVVHVVVDTDQDHHALGLPSVVRLKSRIVADVTTASGRQRGDVRRSSTRWRGRHRW